MKQTVVPAQITTVEDKIAGNVSFKQLLLLVTPVFIGGVMYVLLPPFMGYASYKVTLWITLAVVCLTLAIRVKEHLVIDWVMIRGKYNLRPTLYLYNKNNLHYRFTTEVVDKPEAVQEKVERVAVVEKVEDSKLHRLEQIILEPRANLVFSATKKGGLRVSVKEIE